MPALEAESLSRIVAGKVLVNNISVQVQVGEVLAIVGPSGSGKTSFLRLLNRLDEPTSGIIRFNGQDYRELAPRKLRQRIGMVMQAAYLFPGTVADNVAYGPLPTRANASGRADCHSASARRPAWISGTRREQSFRRRGSTRVDSTNPGERSGNPSSG